MSDVSEKAVVAASNHAELSDQFWIDRAASFGVWMEDDDCGDQVTTIGFGCDGDNETLQETTIEVWRLSCDEEVRDEIEEVSQCEDRDSIFYSVELENGGLLDMEAFRNVPTAHPS